MFSKISKQIEVSIFKTPLMFALLYMLLFNIPELFKYTSSNPYNSSLTIIFDFIIEVCELYFALFILFFAFILNRVVFVIVTLCLFCTGALFSYASYILGIAPTVETIGDFLRLDFDSKISLINLKFLLWWIFSIVVCFYTMMHFKLKPATMFISKLLSCICLLVVLFHIIDPQYDFLQKYAPMNYLHNAYLYLSDSLKDNF